MKDTKNFDAGKYAKEAETLWGNTNAYKEFQKKASNRSKDDEQKLGNQLMDIFAALGKVKDKGPSSDEAKNLVGHLQEFISANYYNCTDQMLGSLGQMYAAGGEFTANIDAYAGDGTATFAGKAIAAYITEKNA